MVLMVSGRCDIVGFYTPWFLNRIKEGFFDVRNPFNPKMVSRINYDKVDIIMFCTKNPTPIVPHLKDINKPIVFHVTLTPYLKDIEPNVPDKKEVIKSIKKISEIIGKDLIVVRYDPIFLNDRYTLDYHKKAFKKLCDELNGYVTKIIISFIDDYKNVRKNMNVLKYREFTKDDFDEIGKSFYKIASDNNMTIQTCYEDNNLVEYGFVQGDCLSQELAFTLSGKKFPKLNIRKGNKCNCVRMADIGVYNSCNHMCKYCYANFDEDKVKDNMSKHNPKSSLLIGELQSDDIIKERVK